MFTDKEKHEIFTAMKSHEEHYHYKTKCLQCNEIVSFVSLKKSEHSWNDFYRVLQTMPIWTSGYDVCEYCNEMTRHILIAFDKEDTTNGK